MDDGETGRRARRRALCRASALALGAGLAWLARSPVLAQGRLAKEAVKYAERGDTPAKDRDDGLQDIPPPAPRPPADCRIVQGPVSPHGHCVALTPRPTS